MSLRSLIASTLVLALIACVVPAMAQDAAQGQPEVVNAKYEFEGVINAPSVYVRSGPSENYYPTVKLEKGSPVTVVGMQFDWLKIKPPEGSFCYVAKLYVEKRGDGTTGRVTRADINVRAGSNLNAMKTTVLAKLNEGDEVQIIGEQEEYFKIKPPADCYLYVNKQFVDQVRAIAPMAASAAPTVGSGSTGASPTPAGGGDATANPIAVAPATQGAVADNGGATPTGIATTQPLATAATQPDLAAQAQGRFDDLEARYSAESIKPVDQQPIDEMLTEYSSLVQDGRLPDSLMEIAQLRVRVLKVRADAKAQLVALHDSEAEAQKRRMALQAEDEEIQTRIKNTTIKTYTAIGTLQPSSLQVGSPTLYRLTDPATGRTVIYIRTADAKIGSLVGQFIGVRGTIANDPQTGLRQISPTATEAVDQTKVNVTVMADITPPSMVPKLPEASTGNN